MHGLTLTVGRHLQQLALTIAAVLGVVCLLMTVAAPLLGVRPLIFLSGSMEPTIPAGSLGFAQVIPAGEIAVGDVVTVPVEDSYLTHRVIEVTHHHHAAALRLQGDGNRDPDPSVHQVTEVPKVITFVPEAGTVVAWFSRPPGVYVLAAYVAFAVGLLRRRHDRGNRHEVGRHRREDQRGSRRRRQGASTLQQGRRWGRRAVAAGVATRAPLAGSRPLRAALDTRPCYELTGRLACF